MVSGALGKHGAHAQLVVEVVFRDVDAAATIPPLHTAAVTVLGSPWQHEAVMSGPVQV